MSHPAQIKFCKEIRRRYREHFIYANIIDCGSRDINGGNRWLFRRNLETWNLKGINRYTGIDIAFGKNVNVVGRAHEVLPQLQPYLQQTWKSEVRDKPFWPIDVVISTEMLEHDLYWDKSLLAMYEILRPGGLLLITAAGDGRMEHGTHMSYPDKSPETLDYYRNISNEMFTGILSETLFSEYDIRQTNGDFQFAGIKS